jgi:predicted RNase H-like HicB family nuclease
VSNLLRYNEITAVECFAAGLMAQEAEMEPTREFTVVIEQDEEGYYVGEAPQLRGCYTQASSLDELMDRMREAIQVSLEENEAVPSLRFVGVQRIVV